MNYRFPAFIAFSLFLVACGTSGPNTNTNVANANTNAPYNSANAVAYSTPNQEPTTNNAPTLTPVVHGYYDALKQKDDAALTKVLARDVIESAQAEMRTEKRKGLAAYLAELDKIPEKPVEVRNEKIEGNKATAEVRGGVYTVWTPLAFVKEDGLWKLTNESNPAIENVTNSNK